MSCANKKLSRLNNILTRQNKLKNKTRMSLPGFRSFPSMLGVMLITSDLFTVFTATVKSSCSSTDFTVFGFIFLDWFFFLAFLLKQALSTCPFLKQKLYDSSLK